MLIFSWQIRKNEMKDTGLSLPVPEKNAQHAFRSSFVCLFLKWNRLLIFLHWLLSCRCKLMKAGDSITPKLLKNNMCYWLYWGIKLLILFPPDTGIFWKLPALHIKEPKERIVNIIKKMHEWGPWGQIFIFLSLSISATLHSVEIWLYFPRPFYKRLIYCLNNLH